MLNEHAASLKQWRHGVVMVPVGATNVGSTIAVDFDRVYTLFSRSASLWGSTIMPIFETLNAPEQSVKDGQTK